jgi:hypothetical protein
VLISAFGLKHKISSIPFNNGIVLNLKVDRVRNEAARIRVMVKPGRQSSILPMTNRDHRPELDVNEASAAGFILFHSPAGLVAVTHHGNSVRRAQM